jgi:hypothetical protein
VVDVDEPGWRQGRSISELSDGVERNDLMIDDSAALEALVAKQCITEVIHRYCRGMDRMDRALTLSCWHPGGTDDHAPLYSGTAEGFVEWLWPVHEAMVTTRHVVTNILVEVHGETAASESYWTVTLRLTRDGKVFDIHAGGRYVDDFECIHGVWAIRHRQSLRDWGRVDEVTRTTDDFRDEPLIQPNNPETEPGVSARDRSDYSYSVLSG